MLDHELWWTPNTFRTLSRAVFSKNRVNRFAPLWDKNSPENRVYLYQSHKCGIKKSNNSLDLHIIKYGFNILTRVLQAKETKIVFVTLEFLEGVATLETSLLLPPDFDLMWRPPLTSE